MEKGQSQPSQADSTKAAPTRVSVASLLRDGVAKGEEERAVKICLDRVHSVLKDAAKVLEPQGFEFVLGTASAKDPLGSAKFFGNKGVSVWMDPVVRERRAALADSKSGAMESVASALESLAKGAQADAQRSETGLGGRSRGQGPSLETLKVFAEKLMHRNAKICVSKHVSGVNDTEGRGARWGVGKKTTKPAFWTDDLVPWERLDSQSIMKLGHSKLRDIVLAGERHQDYRDALTELRLSGAANKTASDDSGWGGERHKAGQGGGVPDTKGPSGVQSFSFSSVTTGGGGETAKGMHGGAAGGLEGSGSEGDRESAAQAAVVQFASKPAGTAPGLEGGAPDSLPADRDEQGGPQESTPLEPPKGGAVGDTAPAGRAPNALAVGNTSSEESPTNGAAAAAAAAALAVGDTVGDAAAVAAAAEDAPPGNVQTETAEAGKGEGEGEDAEHSSLAAKAEGGGQQEAAPADSADSREHYPKFRKRKKVGGDCGAGGEGGGKRRTGG